jgi:hypothetical protein
MTPEAALIGELFGMLRTMLKAHPCICPACVRARQMVMQLEVAAADHAANCPCCAPKGERI